MLVYVYQPATGEYASRQGPTKVNADARKVKNRKTYIHDDFMRILMSVIDVAIV